MVILLRFFSAGIFSITFAICIWGLGEHTKAAAALLTTAIAAGAPFPFIQSNVMASHGFPYGFYLEVILFSLSALFAVYLNVIKPEVINR